MLYYIKNQQKLEDSLPNSLTLNNLGTDIIVAVRYSTRARRVAIRINAGGATLVVPINNKMVSGAGYKFLLSKETWIRQKLGQVRSAQYVQVDPHIIPLFGKIHMLQYTDVTIDEYDVQIKEGIIQIYSSLPELERHNALIRFLKELLFKKIIELLTSLQRKHNFSFSEVKIMNNKTRWGSCSSKGILSFNWRLIFAPTEILNYVVIHELCHTVEMNHSKSFWHLVERLYPDYSIARSWFKENAFRLHQYLKD